MLDRIILAGTGSAAFFLFHPSDLSDRKEADLGWPFSDCRAELAAGSLVAFTTMGDGGHSFRITDGELTDLEKAHHACSWDFRYVVRHNRVFLDGGDNLPSMEQLHDPLDADNKQVDKDCWIDLPNGNYRVSVHAIRSCKGPPDYARIEGLTEYVIRFQPIADLRAVKAAGKLVRLRSDA
jgi:hypothetical protein